MATGLEVDEPSDPPSLDDLTTGERILAMVDWFLENFEDPAERTPYESAEGGYIWIWGGPYDADDELQNYFPDASQEDVEAAVDQIEFEGTVEWAPHGDRLRAVEEDEEPENPLADRLASLGAQLEEVEAQIRQLPRRPAGIGHNRPPEQIEDYIEPQEVDDALQSIAEVKSELQKPDPADNGDAETVERAEGRLRRLASRLWGWAKGLGIALGGGALGEVGKELVADPSGLAAKITSVVSTLSIWLHHLQQLF